MSAHERLRSILYRMEDYDNRESFSFSVGFMRELRDEHFGNTDEFSFKRLRSMLECCYEGTKYFEQFQEEFQKARKDAHAANQVARERQVMLEALQRVEKDLRKELEDCKRREKSLEEDLRTTEEMRDLERRKNDAMDRELDKLLDGWKGHGRHCAVESAELMSAMMAARAETATPDTSPGGLTASLMERAQIPRPEPLRVPLPDNAHLSALKDAADKPLRVVVDIDADSANGDE